ncbi:recombinase family protein [Streptomyces gulbargensis]
MLVGPLPGIDDPSGPGRMLFGFFAAMAETERESIREATLEGLDSAACKGKHGGRPPVITDDLAAGDRSSEKAHPQGSQPGSRRYGKAAVPAVKAETAAEKGPGGVYRVRPRPVSGPSGRRWCGYCREPGSCAGPCLGPCGFRAVVERARAAFTSGRRGAGAAPWCRWWAAVHAL